jgi:hypothetical protein
MVWSESTRLYNEMLVSSKSRWPTRSGETISFTQYLDITHRLALCVILSCGFGLPLAWDEHAYANTGDEGISLDDGIKIQGDNLFLVCYAPSWIWSIPSRKYVPILLILFNRAEPVYLLRIRRIKAGMKAMRTWFNTSILNKKREIAQVLKDTDGDMDSDQLKKDVFSRLTLASQQGGKFRLEDSEIVSPDIWAMSFPGIICILFR